MSEAIVCLLFLHVFQFFCLQMDPRWFIVNSWDFPDIFPSFLRNSFNSLHSWVHNKCASYQGFPASLAWHFSLWKSAVLFQRTVRNKNRNKSSPASPRNCCISVGKYLQRYLTKMKNYSEMFDVFDLEIAFKLLKQASNSKQFNGCMETHTHTLNKQPCVKYWKNT